MNTIRLPVPAAGGPTEREGAARSMAPSFRRRRPREMLLAIAGVLLVTCAGARAEADRLSLGEAIRLALRETGNLSLRQSEREVEIVQSRVELARSALLPHLSGEVTQRRQTVNLEAFGLQPFALFQPPRLVGPFSIFEARAQVRQNLFDLSAIRNYRASRAELEAGQGTRSRQEEQVISQVARAYLDVQRAEAEVEAGRARVGLAEELLRLAEDQKEAGTGTGIDVTRAGVRLSEARQGVIERENELEDARIELFRLIGEDLDSSRRRVDALGLKERQVDGLPEALATAFARRRDLQAQKAREESMRLAHGAAKAERYPSLVGWADYGSIGPSAGEAIPTWSVGVALQIPLFDGGAEDARRHEARSRLELEELRTADLRRKIESEIRTSLNRLESAHRSFEVSEEALALLEAELAQARRRYRAGVATSLEITDAQTRLEEAQRNRIRALHAHNLAWLQLLTAMGTVSPERIAGD